MYDCTVLAGIGDFRVPKDALTSLNGDVITVPQLAPNGRGKQTIINYILFSVV